MLSFSNHCIATVFQRSLFLRRCWSVMSLCASPSVITSVILQDMRLIAAPLCLPSVYVLPAQPNGRFEVGKKICLSISGHHPETWQPSWSSEYPQRLSVHLHSPRLKMCDRVKHLLCTDTLDFFFFFPKTSVCPPLPPLQPNIMTLFCCG